MIKLTRQSPAKINLTLRVTGVRPDGFHEIESLVAQVDLCDTVSVGARQERHPLIKCDDPTIPCDESNLALRAARALAEAKGVRQDARISIAKQIPAGAGLGGGSSNAATTLSLLNKLWGLQLSHHELAEIGARVGSDVPLFCHGPLCVIRGRGEQVEEVDRRLACWAALVLPDLHCSTPAIYAAWDQLTHHPPRPTLEEVVAALRSARRLMGLLFNDLEEPAFQVRPALGRLAERVAEVAGGPVRMTGSGSALFRLFDDHVGATDFASEVERQLAVHTVVTAVRTA